MKTGWIVTVVGMAVLIAGIALFDRYVLAIENWEAITTSLVGLVLVGFGFRGIRGATISRSALVAIGVFLLLLGLYALLRVQWKISATPEIVVLLAAGGALVFVGSRRPRVSPSSPAATV